MKHIKLFEEVNEYYKEINDVEWETFEPILMSKSTIVKIKNIIPSAKLHVGKYCEYIKDGKLVKFNRLSYEKRTEIKQAWYSMTGKNYEITSLSIFEDDDEYFYVSYSNRSKDKSIIETYKCDQFEGLKKLLNDKGIE